MTEFLWYIPNTVEAGHRGDDVATGWADLDQSVRLARVVEDHGWGGALIGTGWGRPDTFTLAAALVARTSTFRPLIAIRPGLLAARAVRQRRRHARPSQRRTSPGQHRERPGQPGRVRGRRDRQGRPLPADQGVHAARAPAVDRGERHLPRRVLRGRGIDGGAAAAWRRGWQASAAVLRRRLAGSRGGGGGRGRRAAVLGGAARRRCRARRPAQGARGLARPGARAAGVRTAGDDRDP